MCVAQTLRSIRRVAGAHRHMERSSGEGSIYHPSLLVAATATLLATSCMQQEAVVVTPKPAEATSVARPGAGQTSERSPLPERTIVQRPAAAASPPPAGARPTGVAKRASPPPARATSACDYDAAFVPLVGALGRDRVGDCLEQAQVDERSGIVEQRTTQGRLIRGSNLGSPMFREGSTTWYLCPHGIESRPIGERYACGQSSSSRTPLAFLLVVGGAPGMSAFVAVQTAPGAGCTIRFVTPLGETSRAETRGLKSADERGRVNWSWLIEHDVPQGTATVVVECDGVRETAPIQIGQPRASASSGAAGWSRLGSVE
jgi:hypothetical protein